MINMVKGHLPSLPLAAAQSLECRALEDSRSRRCLTTAMGNKQYKQKINSIPNST
jgi:hypothetical protein